MPRSRTLDAPREVARASNALRRDEGAELDDDLARDGGSRRARGRVRLRGALSVTAARACHSDGRQTPGEADAQYQQQDEHHPPTTAAVQNVFSASST
jgi:hypothetical protein